MNPTIDLHWTDCADFLDAMQRWFSQGDELVRLLDPSVELATRESYAEGRRLDIDNELIVYFLLTAGDSIWQQLTTDLPRWNILPKMSFGMREDLPLVVDEMLADVMGDLFAILPERIRLERPGSPDWRDIQEHPVSRLDAANFDWSSHAEWVAKTLRRLEEMATPDKPNLRLHLLEQSAQADGLTTEDPMQIWVMHVHAWTTMHLVRMLEEAVLMGSQLHISRDSMRIFDLIEMVLYLHLHDAIRALPVEDQLYHGWAAAA